MNDQKLTPEEEEEMDRRMKDFKNFDAYTKVAEKDKESVWKKAEDACAIQIIKERGTK